MNKKLRAELKTIAKSYDIPVKFKNLTDCSGAYCGEYIEINISGRISYDRNFALSVMFHELGHWYAHKHNIYSNYHNISSKMNIKMSKIIVRTGLKAEKWVDKWGQKACKKYDKTIRYCKSYNTKKAIEWYKNYYLRPWKEHLLIMDKL